MRDNEIDVLCGTHGNEELSLQVYGMLEAGDYEGLNPWLVHPDAAAAGTRYLGNSEIMCHYPGSTATGDPEDAAAWATMMHLGARAGSDQALVFDIHNNFLPGNSFAEVGSRTLMAGVAGAVLLGHTNLISTPYAFNKALPNAVALELTIAEDAEVEPVAIGLCQDLGELATYNMADLQAYYHSLADGEVTFLRAHEIAVEGSGANAGPTTLIPDSRTLEALETIPSHAAFTELDLENSLRQALGFTKHARLFTGYWGYQNMSPILPEGRVVEGQLQRQYFGAIHMEIPAPEMDGPWLNFMPV